MANILIRAGVIGFVALAAVGCSSVSEQQRVEKLVADAVAAIQEKGDGAYADFRVKDGKWFHGDTYVFVSTADGKGVCHPANTNLEGTDLTTVQDADGKYIMRDAVDRLKTHDAIWTDYRWPKPGATEPSKKSSFMMKTSSGGKDLIVGAGFYPK